MMRNYKSDCQVDLILREKPQMDVTHILGLILFQEACSHSRLQLLPHSAALWVPIGFNLKPVSRFAVERQGNKQTKQVRLSHTCSHFCLYKSLTACYFKGFPIICHSLSS